MHIEPCRHAVVAAYSLKLASALEAAAARLMRTRSIASLQAYFLHAVVTAFSLKLERAMWRCKKGGGVVDY